jgi:hypothetical protein
VVQLLQLATKHTRIALGDKVINWAIIGTILNKTWNVCKHKYDELQTTTKLTKTVEPQVKEVNYRQ